MPLPIYYPACLDGGPALTTIEAMVPTHIIRVSGEQLVKRFSQDTSYFYYLLKESHDLALAGILSKNQSLIAPSTECREKPHPL